MNIILKFQDLEPSQVKWKKIERKGNKSYLIPFYKYDPKNLVNQSPLIIQTPKIYLPFKPSIESHYITLSFYNQELDPKHSDFKSFLDKFDTYVQSTSVHNRLTKMGFKIKKKKYCPILYYPEHAYDPTFIIGFSPNKSEIYNQLREQIEWEKVEGRVYGYFIFEIKGLWLNQDKYGLSLELKQAKINPPILFTGYQFLEDDDEPEPIETLNDYQPIQQYLKMLKMGIPKPCVKQKMAMAGLDPNILDYDLKTPIIEIKEIKETKEINKKEKKTEIIGNPLANLLSANLLGSQLSNLKKTPKQEVQQKKKYKSHPFPVPDLDQIKNAIQNLKKTT